MNAQRVVAGLLIACLIVAAVLLGVGALSPHLAGDEITYKEPQSAVRVRINENATTGSIGVKLNGITDASDPIASRTWTTFNVQSKLDNTTLAPPRGSVYLIANVTVTNVRHSIANCSFTDFALVTQDKGMYYPSYAVCNANCTKDLLASRTLSSDFASDIYFLFSLPATAQLSELVYTGSDPPIIISAT